MKKNKLSIILIASMLLLSSCAVLEQILQMQQLAQCKFDIASTQDFKIAGISMQDKKSFSDFSILDGLALTRALVSDNMPAQITINVKANNPNDKTAGMNKLEWDLLLDGMHMTNGVVEKTINIPPNQSTTIPMVVSFNIKQLLKGDSKKSLMNLINSFTGKSEHKSEVALKIKPSILIGNQLVSYPNPITIRHTIAK